MDIEKTKARIDGRKEAEAFIALCAENGEAFMEGVRAAFQATMPKQPEARLTMGDDESKRFEATYIGFGQHQGLTYGDVPIDYLTWIADKAIDLQAYLRSDRGRNRIEKEV
jgi:hypothetical protein